MCLNQPVKNKGFGLPVAIFVITVLAMIVLAITRMDEASSLSFGQNFYSVKAFYAAESGAQIALSKRFSSSGVGVACANPIYTQTFTTVGLEGCSVAVSCDSKTVGGQNYYTFQSTGVCGAGDEQTKRTIEVRARD